MTWSGIINRAVEQEPHQIVDISQWPVHENYEVFPEGARNKSLRVCPRPGPFEFCLAGHNYLFKEAIKSVHDPERPRHPDQYWAEVIAFRIGRLMRLELPPVFVAIDSSREEPGTVNEWFMDYPDADSDRYAPGGDYMQQLIPGYDRRKGRQHNLHSIIVLSRTLARGGYLQQDWAAYWGLCLCFDALIGNTDRHQENWGVIWSQDGSQARFAPYFDNGTSLGHELQDNAMHGKMRDLPQLDRYIQRGKHQLRWAQQDESRMPLIEGVAQFCVHFPAVRPLLVERLLAVRHGDIETMLGKLMKFDLPHPLTETRAEFVAVLTARRKAHLLHALEP